VREAVNEIVKTNMGKLAVIWEDCGYSGLIIQQRCEAVKKHVQSLFDEMLLLSKKTRMEDRTSLT
jgi:acyl CoA:acetate/3-ketoacid CoA transferase alpha subunit